MADNNYSNVIAPSDGVQRFLLKPSVVLMGLAAVIYSIFAFRMNGFEHTHLGGTLRSTMLFLAYVGVPTGILTACLFSRIRALGQAYSMISLIVAALGMFLMAFNAIAWVFHEKGWQGMLGSGLELLALALATAVFVNLVMSCMEFRIVPVLALIGVFVTVAALMITAIRIVDAFASLNFAWDSEMNWSLLADHVKEDGLAAQAKWVFRSIPMRDAKALATMFRLRLYERIAVCVFYGALILFLMDYYREMKAFNKLMEHASEYVEIPKARIAETLAKKEQEISDRLRSPGSVRSRLRKLDELTRAKEQGLDITAMSAELDREYAEGYEEDERPRRRRTAEEDYDEDERPRRRRTAEEDYDEDERLRRRRAADEGYEEDERPRRRRAAEEDDDAYERPRRRRAAEDDDDGYERPRRRRAVEGFESDEDYDDVRPDRERRRGGDRAEKTRPKKRRMDDDDELTEEERYLMEERRKRQASSGRRRSSHERDGDDYRQRRQERLSRRESDMQKSMNEYYDNYMQIREERERGRRSEGE